MKVFLDTNVWLSAVTFPGLCADLLAECADRDWLITCPLVRVEAHAVLARRFPRLPHALGLFDAVWEEAPCMAAEADPADDNDARLVATAVAADADLFVTGDKRVLEWQRSGNMRIVTPREAWVMLFSPGERG